jgi:predicted DNA-binding protein (MmcQ/YjbR family)
LQKAERQLRRYALAFPGAYEEFPWDERVIKVNKKIFLFAKVNKGILRVTVKLPETGKSVLTLPFTTPTGYGLGKSGWVTAAFEAGDKLPVDLLQEWIDESYDAIAPTKLKRASPTSLKRLVGKKRTSTK